MPHPAADGTEQEIPSSSRRVRPPPPRPKTHRRGLRAGSWKKCREVREGLCRNAAEAHFDFHSSFGATRLRHLGDRDVSFARRMLGQCTHTLSSEVVALSIRRDYSGKNCQRASGSIAKVGTFRFFGILCDVPAHW